MLRTIALCSLLGLLGLGAVAAGADKVVLVAMGVLAALGWLGLRPNGRDR